MVLWEQSQRDKLVHRFRESSSEFKGTISITKERTREERERFKALKAELDRRTELGEQNLIISGDRIVTKKQPFPGNPPTGGSQ